MDYVAAYTMSITTLGTELLKNLGGADKNNLNEIVKIFSLDEDHQETFQTSNYYDLDSMLKSFQNKPPSLSVLSLNIEGLTAKFNTLTSFIKLLDKGDFSFSAIMLQETHLPSKIDEDFFLLFLDTIPPFMRDIHVVPKEGYLYIYIQITTTLYANSKNHLITGRHNL